MCQFSIIHQVFNSKMGNGIGILFPFMLVLALFFLSTPQISAVGYPINVWPKPTTFSWPQPQVTLLSPNFSIIFPSNPYLIRAANRYFNQITGENYHPLVVPVFNWTSSQPLQSLTITVADENAPLTHGVNESYTISIPSPNESTKATLTAETIWGAMRGLETFSQLVFGNPTRVATGLYIRDEPLYPHRGVMLDTSRNFYEVEDLLRLIKSMSMNKLNVFHWHITDSQSFPLVLPSEPELAGKGAYGEDMKYSPEDVKAVVEFGMEHGVRVVPGIEMPGHTASWAGAYPDIVTCANMFWWPAGQDSKQLAAEPGTGQLNPLSSKTYKVAKNVIHDVATMFPDEFFHAAADEINHNCWEVDPFIQEFIANNGTLTQLLEMFVNSTLPYIISKNRTVVYWEDILLGENVNVSASLLPKENVILQTWLNGPIGVKKLTEAGYRVIVSSSDFYYLDCGHGDFPGNDSQYNQPPGTKLGDGGSWCGPFKTWQTIYNYDITYGLNEEEAKLVLGGEVALWSEQSDSTVMDSRIWPRASAMAESLWSGNRDATTGMKRYAEATDRLNEWRNRMVKRGIKAEPIQPLWCIRNPGMCNTVHPYIPGN